MLQAVSEVRQLESEGTIFKHLFIHGCAPAEALLGPPDLPEPPMLLLPTEALPVIWRPLRSLLKFCSVQLYHVGGGHQAKGTFKSHCGLVGLLEVSKGHFHFLVKK